MTFSIQTATCSHCDQPPFYRRKYSDETLCTKCFKASIVEKTRKTISRFQLLTYGETVGVAVSGGKDSMSLLYVMHELNKAHRCKLFAITVDEGVEGYRDEGLGNVKEFASKLNISVKLVSYEDLFGFTLDEALSSRREPAKNHSCAMCGPLRRRAIDLAAESLDVDVVATAHNLDDYVQTFYINLFNGDLTRIRWLDPEWKSSSSNGQNGFRIRRVKPFMEIYEQEIALYAHLLGIPFQTETCPYMNEGIRSEVRDMLNNLEAKHPGIKYSTFRSIIEISKSLSIDGMANKSITRCVVCGSISSGSVCSSCKTVDLVKKELNMV